MGPSGPSPADSGASISSWKCPSPRPGRGAFSYLMLRRGEGRGRPSPRRWRAPGVGRWSAAAPVLRQPTSEGAAGALVLVLDVPRTSRGRQRGGSRPPEASPLRTDARALPTTARSAALSGERNGWEGIGESDAMAAAYGRARSAGQPDGVIPCGAGLRRSLRKTRPTGPQPWNVAGLQRGRSGTMVSSGAGRLPRLLRLRAAQRLRPRWAPTSGRPWSCWSSAVVPPRSSVMSVRNTRLAVR